MIKTFVFRITDRGQPVFNSNEFIEYINANKSRKGYMTVYLYDTRDKRSIIGYYKHVFLVEVRKCLYENERETQTEEQVESRVWKMSAITSDMECVDVGKLSVEQIHLLINEIKGIFARDYGMYIQ